MDAYETRQDFTHINAPKTVKNRLPLLGGRNFRDLGGTTTGDGRRILPRRLFRADDLHALREHDLDLLADIPVVTVVDFRATGETTRKPDKLPPSVKRHRLLPIVPGGLEPWEPDSALRKKGGHEFMKSIYRSLVLDDAIITVYRELFHLLLSEDTLPLLFHCSAGKDRTGMAAAFIQIALGVDMRTIMDEYLDSNICLAGKYDREIAIHPGRAAIFFAESEYLLAGIEAMQEKSGSAERYLESVLGVDLRKMRERFLSPD